MIYVGKSIEIIEIKRKGHELQNDEFERLHGYYDAIEKYLNQNPRIKARIPKAHITLICDDLDLDITHRGAYKNLEEHGILMKKTWDEVVDDTEMINKDFLDISKYRPSST